MENEPVTTVTLDFCHILITIFHWVIILMRYSSSLQQCNVVTSRFVNQRQRLKKRGMFVPGSRFFCARTGKCCLKSEETDLWTVLLRWSFGAARRRFRSFSIAKEAGQGLHALISFRNSTYGIATQGIGSLRQERRGSWEAIYLPLHHMPSKSSWQRYSRFQLAIRLGQKLGSSKSGASHRLIT